MPNSNSFTHRMLFFSREATSEIYGPRVSSLSYLPSRSIFIRFYFQIYISKNPKIPWWTLFYFVFIRDPFIQSIIFLSRQLDNFWHRYLKGNDNPFNTLGCKYLFFVCRYHLCSVAWFSYLFDNLDFITDRNTYRSCAASSLPLWENTDVVQADIKRNFWRRCRGGSSHQFLAPLPGRHHQHLPGS